MSDGVGAIEREIEKHRSRLEELEKRKKELEEELPTVKTNLEALTRTLAILQGKNLQISVTQGVEEATLPSASNSSILKENSLTNLAWKVLKEADKPLSPSDLFDRVKATRPEAGKPSFFSGVYRLMRLKKVFKKSHGKIGLLEWKDKSST